jgi:DNA-binding MarR family transcriptional regulator
MERILLEFINTLDLSLKQQQKAAGSTLGFSKLTVHQLQYLNAINDLENPTLTELAQKLRITKASVTVGVNKLIEMGFVAKTQSKADKRVFHVSLKESGKQFAVAKYQALQEYGKFIRSALSREEARQFEATLTKLVALFQRS